MQRKKLTEVVMGAFDTWKAETKKSKQVKKVTGIQEQPTATKETLATTAARG